LLSLKRGSHRRALERDSTFSASVANSWTWMAFLPSPGSQRNSTTIFCSRSSVNGLLSTPRIIIHVFRRVDHGEQRDNIRVIL
jgi:hypothetical protein